MRKQQILSISALATLSAVLFLACPEPGAGDPQDGRRGDDPASTTSPSGDRSPVTAVAGPSWLHHLRLEIDGTDMGQMGGTAPQPGARGKEPQLVGSVEERFQLTGADLYRLSCRSCHGPDGSGSPPEIPSLLDPVRGTSAAAIQARMKARGTPIDDEMAAQLASQAEADVRDRLRKGGEKMPAFEHLRGDEEEALLAYLRQLAGMSGDRSGDLLVPQSAARVGEHLVKGTCHICHDATGPGGHHEVMMGGIIPSLESFPKDYSLDSVLDKVERGSSGMMGMMGMMRSSQEMPTMPYLSQEEIAAGYVYLQAYPPRS